MYLNLEDLFQKGATVEDAFFWETENFTLFEFREMTWPGNVCPSTRTSPYKCTKPSKTIVYSLQLESKYLILLGSLHDLGRFIADTWNQADGRVECVSEAVSPDRK